MICASVVSSFHTPKDVDVAVMDPDNGPLMLVGVRSQMSSVGKNQPNDYEGIVGERALRTIAPRSAAVNGFWRKNSPRSRRPPSSTASGA